MAEENRSSGETQRPKTLEEAAVDAIIEALEGLTARLREIRESWRRLPQEVKAEITEAGMFDLIELDNLPWTRWLKDEKGQHVRAEPGEPGWIKNPLYFKDLPAEECQVKLANALVKAGGRLKLGDYVYSFSGKEKQFINRKPLPKR